MITKGLSGPGLTNPSGSCSRMPPRRPWLQVDRAGHAGDYSAAGPDRPVGVLADAHPAAPAEGGALHGWVRPTRPAAAPHPLRHSSLSTPPYPAPRAPT